MRERLSMQAAPEIIRHINRPRIEHQRDTLFQPLLSANFAHVVMLLEQGILDREVASSLLLGLETLENAGPEVIEWNPQLEDIYSNVEAWLINRLGMEVAGRLHTGRSRNDLYATLTRMFVRSQVQGAALDLLALRGRLLEMAEGHAETLMTGYTHNQPAQPISFGHYLCAIASALERSDPRLVTSYEASNQSSLGACALAGTSFPIDRDMLSDLLGFDGVVANTIDAVATRDYVADALYALAMAGTMLSRFASDLYNWISFECGYLELADAAAGISSIMPQKKNPFALEHIRAKAAHLHSALFSAMACWKNTAYTHSREISQESLYLLDDAFAQFQAACQLTAACLRDIKVNHQLMREVLDRNFAIATDLADSLVQEGGLPFRVAHQIVGETVRELAAQPGALLTGESILPTLAARDLSVPLSAKRLTDLASPEVALARRSHLGGPAPNEVRRMLSRLRTRLTADQRAWEARRVRLAEAEQRLRLAIARASARRPTTF